MAEPARQPAKRPEKKPTRPPDQIVRDIHGERTGLSAAFDTLADELSSTISRVMGSRPVVTTTSAAQTGARWAAALRRRLPSRSS
jgi:hypothetical protein